MLLLVVTAVLYDPAHGVFWAGMAFLGFLQVTAVVLNLLPIPGLDGYGALEPHLSPQTQRALEPAKQCGFFILLILLIDTHSSTSGSGTSCSGSSTSPACRWVLVRQGGGLTRFWSAWF